MLSRSVRAAGGTGANDRIRVGAIGVGGRASLLLQQLPESAQIVGLCDCNLPRAEAFKAKNKANWPVVQDYRRLLDRKDVDAVIVATGEFQRVVPCIHACQAGKDVYAEKPLTLYINEGRALVNAVRHYNRVLAGRLAAAVDGDESRGVRARSQRRTGQGARSPRDQLHGRRGVARSAVSRTSRCRKDSIGTCGSIRRPGASSTRHWMGWMRWRDFSGGEMTNWGAHGVDQIQWALGMDGTGPTEIRPLTSGSNGQVAMRYANGVEVNFVLEQGHGPMGGAVFICEKGKLEINRNKFTSNPPEIAAELRKHLDVNEEERKWSDKLALWQARWHMQNWLDCIRSRNLPVADVEIGHRSISVCHLANIARAVGRPLRWDPAREQFTDDEEANRYLDRPRRHGFELPTV